LKLEEIQSSLSKLKEGEESAIKSDYESFLAESWTHYPLVMAMRVRSLLNLKLTQEAHRVCHEAIENVRKRPRRVFQDELILLEFMFNFPKRVWRYQVKIN